MIHWPMVLQVCLVSAECQELEISSCHIISFIALSVALWIVIQRGTFVAANRDVLSRREIKKARRKGVGNEDGNSSSVKHLK